jgi:hypothetical protein
VSARPLPLVIALLAPVACTSHHAPILATSGSASVHAATLPAPSASARDRAPLPADPSPFHDAVIGTHDTENGMLPNALRLCPLARRTFVCGVSDVPLLSTDLGVVNDTVAEEGVAKKTARAIDGRVVQAFGDWPGGAWLVSAVPGSRTMHAYKWQKETGWGLFASWLASRLDEPVAMGSEPDRLLAAPVSIGDPEKGDDVRRYGLGVLARDTGRASPFSLRAVRSQKLAPSAPSPVLSMANDMDYLYVLAQQGPKLVVDRRGGSEMFSENVGVVTNLGNTQGLTVRATIVSAMLDNPAVIGWTVREEGSGGVAHEAPLLFRSSRNEWEAVDLPPGQTRVAAYDASSVERVFTYAGTTLSLFERPLLGGAWQSIPLPALPPGDRVDSVWLANDDAWLLVTPKDSTREPARLMRMKPVKEVWRVRE